MRPTVERPVERTRLPRSETPPSRGSQILMGLGALVATSAVVLGVPLLLLAAFGTPWPDSQPSTEWLTQPTSSEALLGVLAAVVWLAWAHFVLCLVVEAVAERRRRGLAPHVPGGGVGTQALARRAVVTIALLAGTTVGTLGGAAAAVAPSADAGSPMSAATSAAVGTTAGATEGADGGADGGVDAVSGAEGHSARAGLPHRADLVSAAATDGPTTYYEVRPPSGRNYDTLWDIAARYLDSGVRYKEIWELNKGLSQADGRMLHDADLIHPGWVLRLPNDAHGPGLKVIDHAAESTPGGGATGSDAGASTDAAASAGEATSDADGAGASGGAGAVSGAGASTGPLVDEAWAPFFGVAGGLALAGAYLGLRRRRASLGARQLWADVVRGGAPDPTNPDDDGPGRGSRLRDEADPSTAGWLDRALRSLGSAATASPARVWVGGTGLALAFEEPPLSAPPAPWTANGELAWTLGRDAELELADQATSALPGLVCVGRKDDGALLMLDPETVRGVLALDGDDSVARGIAMSMALDTATHPWADGCSVSLVGFADDLTAAGQGKIRRTDDLARVLEGLGNVAVYQRNACRAAGATSAREARLSAGRDSEWVYHLVLCSGLPSAEELRRLNDLAADPMVALGVVVIGKVPGASLTLTARPDGRLAAPLHGIDVTAQVLTVPAVREITAVYELDEPARSVSLEQLVDRIDAEALAQGSGPAVARLGILGTVTMDASGDVDPARRDLLTELACFLALHPAGVHANRISAALWPRGVDPEVRDSTLRQLGDWLGSAEDGSPVLGEASGVWCLAPAAVALDWDAFRTSLNAAAHQPAAAELHLQAALGLVRGRPFEDVPDSRYSWLEASTVEADIVLAVVLTTLGLAEKAAARGDASSARAALGNGLAVAPANEDLWCSWLRLEGAFGDRESLLEVARSLYAAVAEHGSPVGAGAQTDALVDELLPGYRARVA